MRVLNRTRNLDEESFIIRLQNGYTLFVEYQYEKNGKLYFLDYSLFRSKNKKEDTYILTIEEGEEAAAGLYHEHCSVRDKSYGFSSPQEVIEFLKEKENFKIADWDYHK